VAGAAALILTVDPSLNPDELQFYMESNAMDMGVAGKDNRYGCGKMDMTFPILDNNLDPDPDDDGMPDSWETVNGLNPALNDSSEDPDNDLYKFE
jgi:hypothetical protein